MLEWCRLLIGADRLARHGAGGQDERNLQRPNSLIVHQLRQIMLCLPFTANLISQLKECGSSDPETEALHLLTTWKPNNLSDAEVLDGKNQLGSTITEESSDTGGPFSKVDKVRYIFSIFRLS
ncbi:unnamed protein product [Protopolystoma xenopodis]|uniref:Uncharacterized protein n=1 Tax=Protopolystoma xenopodis TaxID=117903 RepID=A0A3S5B3P7_9PLAT|nr:unnamed protein product [Protopolystoma xenopodis]